MKLKKQDVILLAILLAAALVLGLFLLLTRQAGAQVIVSVAGEEQATFPLDETTDYVIEGVDGGTNTLHIENGEAWLTDATCPDQLCVHQGKIHYAGESIICLPNKVTVTISDEGEQRDVDVVAQ